MNRTSFAALALLTSFVTLVAPGCSSTDDTPTGTGGTTAQPTAGTGALPVAGTTSAGGGGASAGGTAGGGTAAGGSATGGGGAATGGGGAATGGGGAATGGGGASAGTGGAAGGAGGTAAGGGGAGGASNPSCPVKIDTQVACTAAVTCPNATCGAFKLGVKDCSCGGAVGNFTCSSCTYKGGEAIVTPPASALPACGMDDATLEDTVGCTKGDRCKSLDTAKSRFCACWDDPVKGGTAWDCDAMPSSWPK